jgi:hypothetical protein
MPQIFFLQRTGGYGGGMQQFIGSACFH